MSTRVVKQTLSPEDDYGLDAIMKHNAALETTEQFPPYQEDAKGLGIFREDLGQQHPEDATHVQSPLTPRSTTATSEGVRTRSGRSTRGRTDSPRLGCATGKLRRTNKKGKLVKVETPKLTAPLSVLTKDMDVPCRDIDAWVHRSAETRLKEVEKRQGYVTRPMNSFMLYRSAYADRTKAWCEQNNHQVVSSVAGESWPMEPEEIRNQFNEWAKIERANHQAAHPDYKFSPTKTTKKRKGEYSDDDGDGTDVDRDPDGEYRGGGLGRRTRQRGAQYHQPVEYPVGPVGFDSHPYFSQQQPTGYDASHYAYTNPGRPLPSNVVYDQNGIAYHPQTGQMIHSSRQQHYQQHYPYVDSQGFHVPTPASMNGAQGLGGYGLPGGQSEDLFGSRSGTPMQQQQHYNQYGHPVFPQYHPQPPTPHQFGAYQPPPGSDEPSRQQMYEHQQYLHQASQPQTAIDPTLKAELAAGQVGSHFDDAIGDMGGELSDLHGYYEESTSPNQTLALAPSWEPSDELGA